MTESYTNWFELPLRGERVSVWFSIKPQDEAWDSFLNGLSEGEFQQTGCWAKVKQVDGWKTFRVILTVRQKIIGGFQILWRKMRLFKIGYVSRGPVLEIENKESLQVMIDLFEKAARYLRLIALIVHPPRKTSLGEFLLSQTNFSLCQLMSITTATLVIDVSDGIDSVVARMRRSTRNKIKKLCKGGQSNVTVREGNEKDIKTFFKLMLETCKRQGVHPNPSSEIMLQTLWETSQSFGGCRLTIAEHKGMDIAGLFCIPFGNTLSIWRKGSIPEYLHLNPVNLLYHDALSWADLNGYPYCDFTALDQKIAKKLLRRLPLSEEQKKSRDIFNLGFGGQPILMPEALITFPNPIISYIYLFFTKNIHIINFLKKFYSLKSITNK